MRIFRNKNTGTLVVRHREQWYRLEPVVDDTDYFYDESHALVEIEPVLAGSVQPVDPRVLDTETCWTTASLLDEIQARGRLNN